MTGLLLLLAVDVVCALTAYAIFTAIARMEDQ